MQTRLFDVPPNTTTANVADCASAYVEQKFYLARKNAVVVKPSDFPHSIWCQFRHHSALRVHLFCDWIKVIGIDAGMNAAKMIKVQRWWHRSMHLLVVPPMSQLQFPMRHHRAIAISPDGSAPNPARRFVSAVFDRIAKIWMMVPMNEAHVHANDVVLCPASSRSYFGFLAAAAFAKAVRDKVHGPLQVDGSGNPGGTRRLTSVSMADAQTSLDGLMRIA